MRHTGFLLASIFFLTAVVAIFASGLRMAGFGPNQLDLDMAAGLSFCGVVVGAVVGGAIASRSARSAIAKTLAVFTGAACGPPAMILTVTGSALPVILIGSAILFVFVLVVRRLSSRPSDA